MDAADVVQIICADPGAYAEAYRLCAGTLWHRRDVTGLLKVDDMVIVDRGVPDVTAGVLVGEGRAAAARACGEALHAMAVSRAAREHGVGLHPPATVTGRLLAIALDGVDWAEVGSEFLAATLAQLSYQALQAAPAAALAGEGSRAA